LKKIRHQHTLYNFRSYILMTLYTLMLHRIHENGEIVPSEEAPDHPGYRDVGEVDITDDGRLIIHTFERKYDTLYGYTFPVEFFALHTNNEVLRTWLRSRSTCNSFDDWIASASNYGRVTG